jgi:hypothetical protein
MSKYQLKQKQKHYPTTREAISVAEYMQLHDSENDTSLLVISLTNHSNMMIENADFEISMYNVDAMLIYQAKYHFDELNCSPFKSIVPLEKIQVDNTCTEIKAKLIRAESSEKVWNDGAWSNKTINKDDGKKQAVLFKVPIHHKPYHYPFVIPIGLLTFFVVIVYILYWVLQVYEPS